MLLSLLGTLLMVLVCLLGTVIYLDESSTNRGPAWVTLRDNRLLLVKVVYRSLIARFLQRHFRIWSVTLWNRVYVAGDHLTTEGRAHEFEHIRQWQEMGRLRFLVAYSRGLFAHGFRKNPLEVEANLAAGIGGIR